MPIREVWFHFFDSTTCKPYEKSLAIFISIDDLSYVVHLTEIVATKYKAFLKGITNVQLRVYINETSFLADSCNYLEPGSIIGDLGRNPKEPLIVVVPTTPATEALLVDINSRLQIQLTSKQLNFLRKAVPHTFMSLTKDQVEELLEIYNADVIDCNQNSFIGHVQSFYLDGEIRLGQGQGKSRLYFAYSESGGVYVAKIYKDKDTFDHEIAMNTAVTTVPHPNIPAFIESFSIDPKQHAIIMPYYPKSLEDLKTEFFANSHYRFRYKLLAVVARDCFKALRHIHSLEYVHCDVKPANIMIRTHDTVEAVLIDFGAVTHFDEPPRERTKRYCLDVDLQYATPALDWVCLASTLADMMSLSLFTFKTRELLRETILGGDAFNSLKQVFRSLLVEDPSPNIEEIEYLIEEFCDTVNVPF